MAEAFFESGCMAEPLKSYRHNGKRPSFFFRRDKDKREINLPIEQNGTMCQIEFKKSSNPGKNAVTHFVLLEQFGRPGRPGAVISMSSWYMLLTEQAVIIPAAML